jgi:DNA gyrase/topoisomerase IV subunit B
VRLRSGQEFGNFIVEGDSAAGLTNKEEIGTHTAILPPRKDPIERAPAERIYQNNELQGLISATGGKGLLRADTKRIIKPMPT